MISIKIGLIRQSIGTALPPSSSLVLAGSTVIGRGMGNATRAIQPFTCHAYADMESQQVAQSLTRDRQGKMPVRAKLDEMHSRSFD